MSSSSSRYGYPNGTSPSGGAIISAGADYLFPWLKNTGGSIHADILAALAQGRLAVGDVIQWAAYWQGSDLGGGVGRIVAAATGTDDGGSYITAGSYQIEQVFDGVIPVTAFGAKGDGTTDDTATIQAAADFAIASGTSVVFLPAGTYVLTSPGDANLDNNPSYIAAVDLSSASGLAIKGAGATATTVTWNTTSVEQRLMGADSATDIEISGITFDGKCSAAVSWNHAIQVIGTSGLSVIDCRFQNIGNTAIRASLQSSNIRIARNHFLNVYGQGVLTKQIGADRVRIQDNNFISTQGPISIESENLSEAATLWSSEVIITGNQIASVVASQAVGINVSELVEFVTITGNTITTVTGTTTGDGISVQTSRNQSDEKVDTVTVTGNTINGVTASSSRAAGVRIDSGDTAVTNVVVASNVITDVEYGCIIQSGPSGTPAQTDSVAITGNIISTVEYGLFLNTVDSALSIRALAITGNVIRTASADGINLWMDGGVITGNVIDGCVRGIYLNGASTDVCIAANMIRNASTSDVAHNGAFVPVQFGTGWMWMDNSGDVWANAAKPTSITDGTIVGTQT